MDKSIKVQAPGKVILHGEHSVVYGKRAVAISVGLYTHLTISPINEDEIHLIFSEINMDIRLSISSLNALKSQLGPQFNYSTLNSSPEIPISLEARTLIENYTDSNISLGECAQGLQSAQSAAFNSFLFLFLALFDEIFPLSFLITTELPVGAGLGSSASFAVALAGGILIAAQKQNTKNLCIETINRWAYVSEKFVHGSPSGVDNSVAAYGKGIIFKKGHPLVHIPNCPNIRVILVNTKVPRSTKALVDKVSKLKESDEALFTQCIDEIESVVTEVIALIEEHGKISSDLIQRNQTALSTLGVSHPLLDKIIELAKSFELDGKLTGAGGGGCAFVYVPLGTDSERIENFKLSLNEHEFEFWDTVLGCTGFEII